MTRSRFALVGSLLLASCGASVESEVPLFAETMAAANIDGFWALLTSECPVPDGTDTARWPDCATPVWIGGGSISTVFNGRKVSTPARVVAGEPMILQIKGVRLVDAEPDTTGYGYLAARFPGPGRTEAQVWTLRCPASAGTDGSEETCPAGSAAEVLDLARTAVRRGADYRAVRLRGD